MVSRSLARLLPMSHSSISSEKQAELYITRAGRRGRYHA
jgi:hypothetical protein